MIRSLYTASRAMIINKKAMDVTSHNIANANTAGYTRQRIELASATPSKVYGVGSIGNGVEIDEIKQIRNEFLDTKYRRENSKLGEYSKKEEILNSLELLVNEPFNDGLKKAMNEFYNSVSELSKNPDSVSTRMLVRENAITFTKSAKVIGDNLKEIQSDIASEIKQETIEINSSLKQIASLNKSIFISEADGTESGDLRDKRNLLLDELSLRGDIDYYEDTNGHLHVQFGNREVVNHTNYDELEINIRTTKLNPTDVNNLVDITVNGNPLTLESGSLKSIQDLQNNISGDDKGIPYYVDKLNEFMNIITEEINQAHEDGFNLDNETGVYFFTKDGMSTLDYKNYLLTSGYNNGPAVDINTTITAGTSPANTTEENMSIIRTNRSNFLALPANEGKDVKNINGNYYVVDQLSAEDIQLSSEITESADKISASDTLTGVPGNGNVMLKIIDIKDNGKLYDWGSTDDFINSLVSNLGVETQSARNLKDNTGIIINHIQMQKDSISGVSIDEEMSNMILLETAYEANAKIIQTVDRMLGVLIDLKR